MLLLVIKSNIRLVTLKKSTLPLQNKAIRTLYNNCLSEMRIKRNIPIYSTAFLKSPIIVGLFRPCIYLPIHLLSDFNANTEGQSEIPEGCFNAEDKLFNSYPIVLKYLRLSSLHLSSNGSILTAVCPYSPNRFTMLRITSRLPIVFFLLLLH